MAQGKGTSVVGAWRVVGCVAAIGFALFGCSKPKSVTLDPPPAAASEVRGAPAKKSFTDSLLELPATTRLALAKDFASRGLKAPAERREAYALARALLEGFPASGPAASEAATLSRELVARQQLPAADKRPVTDAELLAFADKALASTPKPTVAGVNGAAPTSAPQAYAPSSPGGEVQVKGYYRKDGTYVHPHTRRAPRR